MLYIKRFTQQDVRTSGGGANTLISGAAVPHFFPPPLRPPGTNIKIYSGGKAWDINYGYSLSDLTKNEKRLKNFKEVLDNFNIGLDDIGVFKQHPTVPDAFEVIFITTADPRFSFFNTLLNAGGGGHRVEEIVIDDDDVASALLDFRTFPKNWLVAGAPGTGKSHFLEEQSSPFGNRKSRVTFYPDYSYAKFVGSFRPSVYYKSRISSDIKYHENKTTAEEHPGAVINEPVIDYGFVAGPFMKTIVEALKSNEPYVLIIEELNRANAPAVFGEVFQLLDRSADGRSKFPVTLSDEAMMYLKEKLGQDFSLVKNGLYIPGNLYIWATANNADQGVFPLDTAFKRRWTYYYMTLEAKSSEVDQYKISFGGVEYNWNAFRTGINRYLSSDVFKLGEDRLLAPFFISKEEFEDAGTSGEDAKNALAEKVLIYLKDDVLRHNYRKFFKSGINTMHDIISNKYRLSDILLAGVLDSISEEEEKLKTTPRGDETIIDGQSIPDDTAPVPTSEQEVSS